MRVQMKFVVFLFFLNMSIFSTEYLSSNGNVFFTYSEKNHRIEKINMNIENKNKSIDFMKMGFFIDGRQYEIGENNYTVEKEEQSNIVKLSGKFGENSYEIFVYPSINEKNNLIIYPIIKSKGENVKFYIYFKPLIIGKLKFEKNYFSFENINFNIENSSVYISENIEDKEKKLEKIDKDTIVPKEKGIFLISNLNNQNYFWIGEKSKGNIIKLENERDSWKQKLENRNFKDLYSLILMNQRNHLIVDINKEIPLFDMEEVLNYMELLLITKKYSEIKDILSFLIFDIDKKIMGLIPSDYLDLKGQEVIKTDNYGIYNSYYRRSQFLKIYARYINETKDKEFFEKTFKIVDDRLVKFLEGHISSIGVEEDSGNSRIGKDGFKNFIESQTETAKAFKELSELLKNMELQDISYKKNSDKLNETVKLHFIEKEKIVDYPFSSKENFSNMVYLSRENFMDDTSYKEFIYKGVEDVLFSSDNISEKIEYINFLYETDMKPLANRMSKEIEKELDNKLGLEKLEKDMRLLILYLTMKEKGEIYGSYK